MTLPMTIQRSSMALTEATITFGRCHSSLVTTNQNARRNAITIRTSVMLRPSCIPDLELEKSYPRLGWRRSSGMLSFSALFQELTLIEIGARLRQHRPEMSKWQIPDEILMLVDRHIRKNRIHRAISELDKWLDDNPGDWYAVKLVAGLNESIGRNEEAIRHYRRLAWYCQVMNESVTKVRAIYRIIVRLDPSDEDAKEQLRNL